MKDRVKCERIRDEVKAMLLALMVNKDACEDALAHPTVQTLQLSTPDFDSEWFKENQFAQVPADWLKLALDGGKKIWQAFKVFETLILSQAES